ncbi:MAG: flagellar hook-length control protein FliK, partial [Pseudorhodoplanes sp.]
SGHVTSRLLAERPETLDLLRRDAHQLERSLQDAGLKTSDNAMQFSLRDQGFAGRQDGSGAGSDAARIVIPDAESTPVEALRNYAQLPGLGAGIDIQV